MDGAMSNEYIRIALPDPIYTIFNTSKARLPAVVVVNEALISFPHTDVFPWHLDVTIEASTLAENGMPSTEESAVLLEIGDRIEAAIVGQNALFLARVTWNGIRQILCRVHDPKVADTVLQRLLAERPTIREWRYDMKHDGEWALAGPFFQLFPLAKGHNA
jgi:hypothetical protein